MKKKRAGLWSKKSTLASLFFRNFKETRQKSSQTARCCRSFVAALLRCGRPLSRRFASRVFAFACVLFFCVLRCVRCALSFAYVFLRLLFALSCVELRYVLFFAGFEGKRGAPSQKDNAGKTTMGLFPSCFQGRGAGSDALTIRASRVVS